MDIALLLGLILLNGLFAMAELALVSARKGRLQILAQQGDRGAGVALRLAETPTQFLSTVQIGITAIGVLNGIIGEAALAGGVAEAFVDLGLGEELAAGLATTVVVIVITYATIVLGELVPKRLAQLNPEGIARLLAGPVALLAVLSRPFVVTLSASTEALLRLLGNRFESDQAISQEDIHALLTESSQAGVIEFKEHEMVRNVFRLDDRRVASLMTPRNDIVYLDLECPLDEVLPVLIETDHSRFPVCRGGLDNVSGVITARRLLRHTLKKAPQEALDTEVLPAVFVPESMTGIRLLERFRESGVQMVFVVDEYGDILGLITLQDFLEALAGEFEPDDPTEKWAVQRADGSWLLDGMMPVLEVKDRLALGALPDEDKQRYNTLAGMMMWLFGTVPNTGDHLVWENWRFEVVDLDGKRIDKVLAHHVGSSPNTETPGNPEGS
jgi:putative hemolysin